MNPLLQILERLLGLLPPRFGQTLLLFGCISMVALLVLIYGLLIVSGEEIPISPQLGGLILVVFGASMYTFYVVSAYITQLAVFFIAVVSWIEGVAAVAFLTRAVGILQEARAKSSRTSRHQSPITRGVQFVEQNAGDRLWGYLRPRVPKYLFVAFVMIAANVTAGWAVYTGILRNESLLSLIFTVMVVQSVAGAIVSTVGIAWKMRYVAEGLLPVIGGFIIAVLGVNIYSFRSLTGDLFNMVLSVTVFAIAYLTGVVLLLARD